MVLADHWVEEDTDYSRMYSCALTDALLNNLDVIY